MWDVFSLPDPRNKYKKWDIICQQSRFILDYVKRHVNIIQKGSEADQYMFQNLTWSGLYLRSTLSNTPLQKVLTLVPLASTKPEVFVANMTTFLSDSCDALKENLTHMNSLKLKSHPEKNLTDFCASILLDSERLESAGAFKPEHLWYITRTFEDTYDSRFNLWEINKYKEVMKFIKKHRVCDMDVISPEELITYESFLQEATREYHNIVNSKWWEPATVKDKYKEKPPVPKAYTVAIDK